MTLILNTAYDTQLDLKEHIQQQRKSQKLSVEALSEKSGVPYSTIRKFERTGNISLRQFLMLVEALGELNQLRQFLQQEKAPKTIDEVLNNA
ncbi:helix-turn-helix domain-containing protein [Idiomarina aminovorans]|uniref:helix-turn-helix domain-containing protein n=1 Tax=Idiomarina aminovorans TaxID=2914829 RepID=UPI002002E421|nr:helix-turn-helix transcriptional regulator [Idiomarina sp. ATCH4]MCK7459183.1 helix-turn-helix transcriptional regulator [Idiomarina sp. ATCH4]